MKHFLKTYRKVITAIYGSGVRTYSWTPRGVEINVYQRTDGNRIKRI